MVLWNADTFNLKISLLFHAVLQRLLLGSMKNNKKPLRGFFFRKWELLVSSANSRDWGKQGKGWMLAVKALGANGSYSPDTDASERGVLDGRPHGAGEGSRQI